MTTVAQVLVDIAREHILFRQSAHFVEVIIILRNNCFKCIKKKKEKACAVDVSLKRNSESPHRKCLRCGSEDHMIAKCPKPPKHNEKRQRQVRFIEKGNHACDNGKNNDDQKIYACMAQMSSYDECKV